jgi:hypothetical protein
MPDVLHALPRPSARLGWWLLAAAAVLALGGCGERRDSHNPFIGPYGSSQAESFE